MADKKISELVSLAGKDVAATDLFPVVDVSVSEIKSLTRDELRNAVGLKSDASANVSFGPSSHAAITTGGANTALGESAGGFLTVGSRNTAIGHAAGRSGTGDDNTYVGDVSGINVTGGSNVAIGAGALKFGGGGNTAVGALALMDCTGDEATAVGNYALGQATGDRNVAVGASAGGAVTTGVGNTHIGWNAGGGGVQPATANFTIVIGYNVSAAFSGQIVIGGAEQNELLMFGLAWGRYDATRYNAFMANAGRSSGITGYRNIGIGGDSMISITSGEANIAIGHGSLELHQSGSNNVAIGVVAGQYSTNIADSTLIGGGAARYATTGVGGTIIGFRALQHAASVGNNTCLGDSALYHTQGTANVGIGYVVAEGMSKGNSNIAIGRAAMRYRDDGDYNVFIGEAAGCIYSNSLPGQPGEFIGVGFQNPADVLGGAAAGHYNVGIGGEALRNFLGSDSVAIGYRAGGALVGTAAASMPNVCIGHNAGYHVSQKADANNSIAIGAETFTTKDNQAVLGNSSVVETVLRGVQLGTVFTVANLPVATSLQGARAFVSDATAATFASVVSGGGANAVPVYCDGAAWRVG